MAENQISERKMIAHHQLPRKAGIMKVEFPTSKTGTAQTNLVINDFPLTCYLFAGTLHLQCLAASGLSQERSWIVPHYHLVYGQCFFWKLTMWFQR